MTLSISHGSDRAPRHLHNDIQHNDTQHNDIQYNDTQHKGLICDTKHNNTVIFEIEKL